jgi:hypothetical protein
MLFVFSRCIKLDGLGCQSEDSRDFRHQVTELQNDALGNEHDETVDLCDDCRLSHRHHFLSAGTFAL